MHNLSFPLSHAVSEIRIERIASLFMLCWNLFKTAIITYSVVKAFEVLGKILKHVILFLQEKQFFEKLRRMGGWVRGYTHTT